MALQIVVRIAILLALISFVRAQTSITGRTIAFSNGVLAAAATVTLANSTVAKSLGLIDAKSDTFSPTQPASALWVNVSATKNSPASTWARRFGFSNQSTIPDAVTVLNDAVFVATSATTPLLYKLDVRTGKRILRVQLGAADDQIILLDAPKSSGEMCPKLIAVAKLAGNSPLLVRPMNESVIAAIEIDSCTGVPLRPILLNALPVTTGVRQVESIQGIAFASDTNRVVYIATRVARVVGTLANLNAVLYRIDFEKRTIKNSIMPRTDVQGVRVAATNEIVYMALDRHPSITDDEGSDSIEVFPRDPKDLEPLTWGAKVEKSRLDLPFTANLPRRSGDSLTRVIAVEALPARSELVLLLVTSESSETWSKITNTAPDPAVIPAVTRQEMQPAPEAETASTFSESTKTEPPHAIILVVDANARIARRIDSLSDAPTCAPADATPVLPNIPANASTLNASDMAVDATTGTAYIVGTARLDRLWFAQVVVAGRTTATPSPLPRRACIGVSSSDEDGRPLFEVARNHSKMRLQRHPRAWAQRCKQSLLSGTIGKACSDTTPPPVNMLCHEFSHSKARLCATPTHVVSVGTRLLLMREFCKSVKCTIELDSPWNYKAPCGTFLHVYSDVSATQHVLASEGEHDGDGDGSRATRAVRNECKSRNRFRLWWTLNSL